MGLITAEQRVVLDKIYQFNPILFDFATKRVMRSRKGNKFSDCIFQMHKLFEGMGPKRPASSSSPSSSSSTSASSVDTESAPSLPLSVSATVVAPPAISTVAPAMSLESSASAAPARMPSEGDISV